MIKIIVDNELTLKEVDEKDTQAIFTIIDHEREYLRKWLPFADDTKSVEYTAQFVKESIANAERYAPTFVILFQDKVIGLIGFKGTDTRHKFTEIGYWLSQHYQHMGIITRCCKSIMHYAFDNMQMNRLVLRIAVGNAPSIAVAKRLGFTCEGTERDGELLIDGYTDINVFSLLKRDKRGW